MPCSSKPGVIRGSPGLHDRYPDRTTLSVRAAELGLVTRVVPDEHLFATASETAQKLAAKPGGALRASKRLLKQGFTDQTKTAIRAENQAFSEQVRSAEAKEALQAFLEKRPPNFAKKNTPVAAE